MCSLTPSKEFKVTSVYEVWSVTATRGERAAHQPKFGDNFTVLDRSLLLKNFFFYLSCLFSGGPPWWHRPGLLEDLWWLSSSHLNCSLKYCPQCYHSWCFNPVGTQEAVMKLCVWYLFMVQFPPAFWNFYVCQIPAWNSKDDSCFVAVICSRFFGLWVL